jgi:hypothetical protein
MKHVVLAAVCALALAGCVKGPGGPACSAGETNRCSCAGGGEGLQECLPSREAFTACVCSDACAGGAACVSVPALIGMDMDQAGAAVDAKGLRLPDPVDAKGFVTVQQLADPPVQVLDQSPRAGTLVKAGTRLTLTVTLPPDQESLGLPNSNFLVGQLQQDTEQSAKTYYEVLDPGPFPTRATFADWKEANGFGTPADAEASAIYMTHTDLGFGRHMHMRRKGRRVAFYVDNYPTIEDTIAGTRFFATVAMEWSPGPNGRETDPYFTQFYVFNKRGERITDPILDDHGPKQNPAVCLVCHGGNTTDPAYANGGKLGARFIPFDLDAEEFVDRPGYRRADQEAAFKAFNEAVAVTWQGAAAEYPPADPPPVPELVDKWYGGAGHPSPTFLSDATPDGWNGTLEARDLYHKVFARSCQTCHAQREATRNFSTYAKFFAAKALIEQRVFEEGAMPLSQRGALNFWLSYPHQPKILADWLGTTLRSPGKPIARIAVLHDGPFLTPGTQVLLDGTGSQYATEFAWRQTAGPAVELVSVTADRSKVRFVAPAGVVTMTFELVVSMAGRNSVPVAAAVSTQGAPTAPLSVAAVAGVDSATVSWTAPASGGNSPIQHSTVTASPGGTTVQVTGSGTQTLVTGLTPGTTYVFTVVATNEVGDSPQSAPSNAVTVFTNPGAPTGVVATRGNQQVTLGWTAPANTGGIPLTGYRNAGSPAPTTPVQVPPSPTTAIIAGLTNGVSYVFTVVAENGALGPGAPSNAVTPATIPGAPGAATAAPGNASATVTWTAPASNGGDPISSYTVVSTPGGVTVVVGGSTLGTTVNGLANNVTYTFTVTAANTVGSGPSATSNAVLPSSTPGVPSQPQNVTAAFANVSQTATVSWSPPVVTGNSALTGYQITGIPGPGAAVIVGPGVTSTNIPGLTGGLTHTFTVVATNSQGAGPGGTSNSVLIQGPPQAPTLTSLVPGFVSGTVGTLQANWNAPANTGGLALTGYVITTAPAITPVNVPVVNSSTLTSVEGLARCTIYTVSVAAKNFWGTGPASNALAARDALSPATISTPTATPGAASISLSWTAPSDRGCPITQYNFSSTPAGLGGNTFGAGSTSAFISQNTCAYSATATTSTSNCSRNWSFQAQAQNIVGVGIFSGSTAAIRPLVSYVGDNVVGIWTQNPTNAATNHTGACTGCHTAALANPLQLDGTSTASFNSIIANPFAIPNSYLLLCPTNSASCQPNGNLSHPGGLKFPVGSPEYLTIQQWLNDGHPF